MPRGADAVIMVGIQSSTIERSHRVVQPRCRPAERVRRHDLASGETVLRRGKMLTSREIGVLAAIGLA